LVAPAPGTRSYTKVIVAAQMLAQIGAFALPALLLGYIARWDFSKTEAGWLVGVFFAAYVVMVPLLLSLTDRIPVRRVYMLGTGLTALSHFGFALFADGFWSALLLRITKGGGILIRRRGLGSARPDAINDIIRLGTANAVRYVFTAIKSSVQNSATSPLRSGLLT
jgi:MFS family permease